MARLEVHGAPDERAPDEQAPDEQDAQPGDEGRTGSDEGRAARGALWFATNGIVVKGAQTLVLLTLAATLAPSALGLVALGTLVVNVSAILGNLGTSGALVYWRGDVRAAARTAVTIGLVSASAMTLLLWFTAPALATALRAEDGGAAVIRGLVVTLPALAVAAVTQELLRRELRFLRRIVPEATGAVVGAVVAVYRARVVDGTQSDLLVLAGPALIGLAAGHVALWLMGTLARVGVRRTGRRGLPAYLATRRLARSADAAAPLRVLVAAGVVAGLAVTGAVQVAAWADETARLQAGAPLRYDLERGAGGDAASVLALTERLDPEGAWLMGAVLVPGEGSVPARRAFVDVDRFDRVVGDFYAGTSAARIGGLADRLVDPASAAGVPTPASRVLVEVAGVSPREEGRLRPRVEVALRRTSGQEMRVRVDSEVGLDGASRTVSTPVDCVEGCTVVSITLARADDDRALPFLVTDLRLGSTSVLDRPWSPADAPSAAGPGGPVEVAEGLLAPASDEPLTAVPSRGEGAIPVLVTRTATWDGDPVLESPGGEDLAARVLARFPALPLVEADGVYADLPRAAAGAPPTIPAAEVMVLARDNAPDALLAALEEETGAQGRPLARVTEQVRDATGAAQAQAYLMTAICCLLVALLVLVTAVARQREAWVRDVAALRAVGVDRATLRRSTVVEAVLLLVATGAAVVTGVYLAVALLLGRLGLVLVPEHAVALRTAVAPLPLVLPALLASLVVVVVLWRGREVGGRESAPAVLREEAR